MINWATIENALHAWVVAGSGLPAEKVIWAQQDAPRPAPPFIAMRLRNPQRIGQDWLDVVDAGVTPGQEIQIKSRGTRTMTLSLQAFSAASTGINAAVMQLDAVRSVSNLPTVRDALNTAGLGLGPFEGVQSLDGVLSESVFEPRATMGALLFLSSEVSEFATYIETAEITNEIESPDVVFEVP